MGRCLWRSATNRRVIRLQPYRCRRSYLNSQPHPLKQNTPKETTSAQGSASVKLSAECGWDGGAEADLAERKKMEKITQWWGMVSAPFARNGTRVLHGAGQMQPFRTPAGRIGRESLFLCLFADLCGCVADAYPRSEGNGRRASVDAMDTYSWS